MRTPEFSFKHFIPCLVLILLASCGPKVAPQDAAGPSRDGCNEVYVQNKAYEDVTVYLASPRTRLGRVPGLQERVFVKCNLMNRDARFDLVRRVEGEAYTVGRGQRIEDWDGFYIRVDPVFLNNSHLEIITIE